MKRFAGLFLLLLILTSFTGDKNDSLFPPVRNISFRTGEELNYRVNFGIFTVGHATTRVEPKIFHINSRPCYKVDAFGATSGMVAWVTKVRDQWGAYLDTTALVTHVSYRKIREGRYRKDELITYNHEKREAEVKVLDEKTNLYGSPKVYKTPTHVRDMVAGFMYLRVIDFAKYKTGDTLAISGFFEDTAYEMKIMYQGRESVTTKVGKIPCLKLVPVMPDNKVFDGENSITCWISDDRNKIPVKIQAKMFIGSTGIELTSFKGLRNQLRILQP